VLKLFLVEDEVIVREGIKNIIKWEEIGLHFCGEASDGELAYPMIQNEKPDILITDIRMPFMDGLELSRLIKKEMPWMKIIILSGYGEFTYAKEAINIGVTEYLLKPISSMELIKCLKKVRDSILKEQEEKANLEKYKRDMKEYVEEAKCKLFLDLIGNSQSLMHVLERGNELNLELSAMAYNIILYRINTKGQTQEDLKLIEEASLELEALFEDKKDVIKFDCFLEGTALLIKGNSLENVSVLQKSYIEKIKLILNRYSKLTYFGGVGIPVKRLGELINSYQEASRAFAYRYILDMNEIIDYTLISEENRSSIKPLVPDMEGVIKLDKRTVEGFLKVGNIEDIHYFVEAYLKSIGNDNRNSLLFRQYMVMDMYYIVAGFCEELGLGTEVIKVPFKEKSQFTLQVTSFDATKRYIKDIFTQVIELREELSSRQYNDMINKAKIYINEHYKEEELSLNQVAAKVFISPNHFSAMFSQKTGQTFIKYLTDLRMNKAKELLKCSDMRTAEIGYQVGYKDPHYFSYLFKKTQNCTPKQYRCSNRYVSID
jgi:two-component system response regulator YesN